MSVSDLNIPLCQDNDEIAPLYNKIMSALKLIDKVIDKTEERNIFKISGAAPQSGWISNFIPHTQTKNFMSDEIGRAVHNEDSITNFDLCAAHYRDIYVWHSWLKINEPDVKFIYKPVPLRPKIFIPEITTTLKKNDIEDLKKNFYKSFTLFHDKYPIIGQLHRCLIISRFIENTDLSPENNVKLQCFYYPLFFSVNLFIHLCLKLELQSEPLDLIKRKKKKLIDQIYKTFENILRDINPLIETIIRSTAYVPDNFNTEYNYIVKNLDEEKNLISQRRNRLTRLRQRNRHLRSTILLIKSL